MSAILVTGKTPDDSSLMSAFSEGLEMTPEMGVVNELASQCGRKGVPDTLTTMTMRMPLERE